MNFKKLLGVFCGRVHVSLPASCPCNMWLLNVGCGFLTNVLVLELTCVILGFFLLYPLSLLRVGMFWNSWEQIAMPINDFEYPKVTGNSLLRHSSLFLQNCKIVNE